MVLEDAMGGAPGVPAYQPASVTPAAVYAGKIILHICWFTFYNDDPLVDFDLDMKTRNRVCNLQIAL